MNSATRRAKLAVDLFIDRSTDGGRHFSSTRLLFVEEAGGRVQEERLIGRRDAMTGLFVLACICFGCYAAADGLNAI